METFGYFDLVIFDSVFKMTVLSIKSNFNHNWNLQRLIRDIVNLVIKDTSLQKIHTVILNLLKKFISSYKATLELGPTLMKLYNLIIS